MFVLYTVTHRQELTDILRCETFLLSPTFVQYSTSSFAGWTKTVRWTSLAKNPDNASYKNHQSV